MGFSYSKVECHNQCPFKFRLRYIEKLETIPDNSPSNAFYLGTACHEGIENRSIDKAFESYNSNYETTSLAHDIEKYKLRLSLEKAIKNIPEGEYERKLLADDGFIGFIDCLVPVSEGVYDLLDFKYSNNIGGYSKKGQVHLYKYYFEKLTGEKIRDLYYVFIPKSEVTYELNESLDVEKLKSDIDSEMLPRDIIMQKIDYDPDQVRWFFARKALMEKSIKFDRFEKRQSGLCKWCEYNKYCSSNGADISELKESIANAE